MPVCNFIIILLIVLFSTTEALSDPCGLTKDIHYQSKQLIEINDKLEDSPFILACKKPQGLLKNRPKTGLFRREVIESDSQGALTRELLEKVIHKIKDRIDGTRNQIQNIEKCLHVDQPKCEELNNWTTVELPKYVKKARYHLSLAQSQTEVRSWFKNASYGINENLNTLGGYKLNEWSPLTKEEKMRAYKQLKVYRLKIRDDAIKDAVNNKNCKTCIHRFSEDTLLAIRFQQFQKYQQMIAEVPLLQYLTGPEVNTHELISAFNKMKMNLDKEEKLIEEYENMLNRNGSLPAESLKILNYSSQLEEVLLEENQYCGLATSLVYTLGNVQLGNSLAIGLPILISSFYSAPFIALLGGTATAGTAFGIGSGIITGGAFALKSYKDFEVIQQRTLSHLYGDPSGKELMDLERANRQSKYDTVTLPVGFGLTGFALKSLNVKSSALITSRKILLNLPD